MKILSIGNSFSEDAQRYLSRAADAVGIPLKTVNLVIGGCSLEQHHQNMLSGEAAYRYDENGNATNRRVSITEGLTCDDFDIVTLQQVSHFAPLFDTYEPYLSALAALVRKHQPRAKIYLQQTWAYENGSQRLCEELGYQSAEAMLSDVRASCEKAKEAIRADGIIPSGELMLLLSNKGTRRVHRDTFHADLGFGRYALALLWLRTLCGVPAANNRFSDFDIPVSEEERRLVFQAVDSFPIFLNR